ncbi:MAG: MlaD family protein [Chitinispirillia bacterium]|nr:MlaD family protein [Chitinispirillia bacterium]MCL2241916.1 MlaD family protein [Chitinispirillia bacterium]
MPNKASVPVTEPLVRRYRTTFVAIFVLVPVIVMPALLIYTMAKNDSFQQWCKLHVVYENSQGLKKGNGVSMSGIAIGHVKEVDLVREGEIHVAFNLGSRYKYLVKKDTKARMQQRGFVGDWEIVLTGGSARAAEVEDGDTLGAEKTPSLDAIIELATGAIDTAFVLLNGITSIVKGIEGGEGTVGQILKNDTLFRHINQISANTAALTSDARRLTRDVQGTIRGVDNLLHTVTNVTSDVAKTGISAVDSLMAVVNTMTSTVNKSLGEVELILQNVKAMSNEAPELMDRLQHDLGEVELMLRSFQEGWLFKSMGGGDAPKNPHLADTP